MELSPWLMSGTIIIGLLAFVFAISNGYRDASTIVATVVSTRALAPSTAFLMCAFFEFIGVIFLGSAVVATIGKGLFANYLSASRVDMMVVLVSALVAVIVWGIISWWRAWPTSNNQALIAGLIGASLSVWGLDNLNGHTILVLLAVLVLSPLVGFLVSVGVTFVIRSVGERMTIKARPLVKRLHIASCMLVACAHGSNNGQMIIALVVLAFGFFGTISPGTEKGALQIPLYIKMAVALSMTVGVLFGGKRLLKKLGMKFYRIQPTQGLGAQVSSAATILTCALTGFPASAMQVITGSIVGAGVAKNPRAIRWQVAEEIVLSWVLTLPAVTFLSFVLSYLMSQIWR